MARIPVFYSFHFDNDVFRVQQIRNMGVVDGDEPVSPNDWEQIMRSGDAAVKKWIDDNMTYRRCVIVLIGEQTANRPWVRHEIVKAWNEDPGLFGVYIHNLKDPKTGTCRKGADPFSKIEFKGGGTMSQYIKCEDPSTMYPNGDIKVNMEGWVNTAIAEAKTRSGK